MTQGMHSQWVRNIGIAAVLALWGVGCKPSQLLDVPPPTGLFTSSTVQGQLAAQEAFNGAASSLNYTLVGNFATIALSGELADEFTNTPGTECCANSVDARLTASFHNSYEIGDSPLQGLLQGRSDLLVALTPLQKYESGSGLSYIGEAYALIGYTELLMAEDYCAGVPLSHAIFGGGTVYGKPITTDSLLGVAEAHFDSALAHANGNDTVTSLASVGLGRTFVDRARYDSAAMAVANVPTAFSYSIITQTGASAQYGVNFYESMLIPGFGQTQACTPMNMSDREGTNGLDFVSAHDPRLVIDSTTLVTCDFAQVGLPDKTGYYPVKFGEPSSMIPISTGLEARLDEAEAALAGGSPSNWLTDLNALRTNGSFTVDTLPGPVIDTVWGLGTGQVAGQTAGLRPLTDPGTTTAEQDLMFRERAFWLFGTGTRLGDLRRLIRQYNRGSETVFPTGTYDPSLQGNTNWTSKLPFPITNYGPDVNMTLPTNASSYTGSVTDNPYYKGCITPTTTA